MVLVLAGVHLVFPASGRAAPPWQKLVSLSEAAPNSDETRAELDRLVKEMAGGGQEERLAKARTLYIRFLERRYWEIGQSEALFTKDGTDERSKIFSKHYELGHDRIPNRCGKVEHFVGNGRDVVFMGTEHLSGRPPNDGVRLAIQERIDAEIEKLPDVLIFEGRRSSDGISPSEIAFKCLFVDNPYEDEASYAIYRAISLGVSFMGGEPSTKEKEDWIIKATPSRETLFPGRPITSRDIVLNQAFMIYAGFLSHQRPPSRFASRLTETYFRAIFDATVAPHMPYFGADSVTFDEFSIWLGTNQLGLVKGSNAERKQKGIHWVRNLFLNDSPRLGQAAGPLLDSRNPAGSLFTNRMTALDSESRNSHIHEMLAGGLNKKRILILYGDGHRAMLKEALTESIGEPRELHRETTGPCAE